MSSDQALSDQSGGEQDVPRHFMVISRPCNHPETPPRDGYIRGQYESVEFIREIPIYKKPPKSASTPNLSSTRDRASSTLSKEAIVRNAKKSSSSHEGEMAKSVEDKAASSENKSGVDTRARGATISNDGSDANGEDAQSSIVDDESECNPIEWIMITRSDPGGSVPRFMIERGTPGGIVSDASKFLDWACGKDIEDLASDDEAELDELAKKPEKSPKHDPSRDLHNYQTNGHLSGIEEVSTPKDEVLESNGGAAAPENTSGGLYGMVTGAAGAAGGFIAAHTPAIISDNLPHATSEQIIESPRRDSISSDSSVSSSGSFTSALEKYESVSPESATLSPTEIRQEKELQKLEEKKRKLDEKLAKTREKESSKSSEDSAKEAEAIKKAEEKHDKEKKKHEERYKREIEKLERKKEKEAQKAEEKLRKAAEKDEKVRLLRELEEVKAEVGILRKEREILRAQVGDLQAENTTLAAKIGRLSPHGEEVLKDVRAEVGKTGRMRASSLKGLATKSPSVRSSGSLDRPRTGESGGFAKS